MIPSKALILKVSDVSAKLKKAAVWKGSQLAVDAGEDHFLYEQYCYFHIALSAAKPFDLRIVGRTGLSGNGHRTAFWPQGPGLKKNYSYISLMDKSQAKETFQLCPGIRVEDIHGKDRAVDVTLQKAGSPSTPSPVHSDVLALWDAKYTIKPTTALSDKEVSDFIFTFMQLGGPTPPGAWTSAVKVPECQRSGLITNALPSTEKLATLAAYKISETSRFPDNAPLTRP
jgi:hypothetical protein